MDIYLLVFLACIISEIISNNDIEGSINVSLDLAKEYENHEECLDIISKAISLTKEPISPKEAIKIIGEGWVGEEALAIAIYCSLKYKNDFKKAIIAAVNHDGDSDSTGAITGNILGVYLGLDNIPKKWLKKLELLEVITDIADDIRKTRGRD